MTQGRMTREDEVIIECRHCGQPTGRNPRDHSQDVYGWDVCDGCGLAHLAEFCGPRGIPKRYLGAKLADFPQPVRDVLAPGGTMGSLCLWGAVGVGKTHAAAALAMEYMRQHRRGVEWWTYGDLLRAWRQCFGDQPRWTETSLMLKLADPERVLFVDDVGDHLSGEDSHGARAWFCDTMDARYGNLGVTVLTSNLNPAPGGSMAQRFDARLASRIVGWCSVVEFDGRDRRQPS